MTDCVDFCESFARRGYVCASINYRLSNMFSFLLSQDVQLETVLKAVSDKMLFDFSEKMWQKMETHMV